MKIGVPVSVRVRFWVFRESNTGPVQPIFLFFHDFDDVLVFSRAGYG